MNKLAKGKTISRLKLEATAQSYGFHYGRLKAEAHFNLLQNKKAHSYLNSAREHIGRIIDRIDPLECVAIATTTILLQPIVYQVQELVEWIQALKINVTPSSSEAFIPGFQGHILGVGLLSYVLTEAGVEKPQELQATRVTYDNVQTIMSWLLAFTLSFFAVRYGGQILDFFSSLSIGSLVGKLLK